MNKITTEFQDGQILHAADLNPLITSINQAADELATKANSVTLANTTRTANNALTDANNAATIASQARNEASEAHTEATEAKNTAAMSMAHVTEMEGKIGAATMGKTHKATTPDIVQIDTTLYIFQGNQAMTVRLPSMRNAQLLIIKNLSAYPLTIQSTGTHIYDNTSTSPVSSIVVPSANTLNLICSFDQTLNTTDYYQF